MPFGLPVLDSVHKEYGGFCPECHPHAIYQDGSVRCFWAENPLVNIAIDSQRSRRTGDHL